MNQGILTNDWVTTLMGENLLFGLLGKILYTEPEKCWLESLIDGDVFAEVPFGETHPDMQRSLEYLQDWSQENRSGISEQALMAIRIDYTHLFVGLEKVVVPLWESVYKSEKRLVFQEETLQVRRWYRRYGLASEKLHQEPDDHIGLELAFLAHLAYLGLQACDQNDEIALQKSLAAQREFLSNHLGLWVLKWCSLVEQNARTGFYKGLSCLTRGAVSTLAEILEVNLTEEI